MRCPKLSSDFTAESLRAREASDNSASASANAWTSPTVAGCSGLLTIERDRSTSAV